MALFAIGDLHGHLRALEALLAVIQRAEADPLIFLGDYVDKGPEVCGVLDRLCQLAEGPETYFLRGNHDQMLLDAASDATLFGIWECLAGDRPLASYGAGSSQELLRAVPQRHWDFLAERTLPFFETADFIFVHGWIRPDRSSAEEDPERLQWLTLSMAEPHGSGRRVVCGHSAQISGRIADLGHTLCLDTGISKGGWLTCLDLESFRYWQADATGKLRQGLARTAGPGSSSFGIGKTSQSRGGA